MDKTTSVSAPHKFVLPVLPACKKELKSGKNTLFPKLVLVQAQKYFKGKCDYIC